MITKNILLAGLLMVTSLSAESKTIFALNNQYFSETMPKEKSEKPKDGQMIGARYDVGGVIVSTNLAKWKSGVLGSLSKHDDGYFIVDVKQPITNWTVSTSVSYRFHPHCNKESVSYGIRLGAGNGESIYITTNPCDIVVQNTQIKVRKDRSLDHVALNYFIKTKEENIVVMLNAQVLATFPKGEFDTLKTVELGIGARIGLYGLEPSHLINLTIAKK